MDAIEPLRVYVKGLEDKIKQLESSSSNPPTSHLVNLTSSNTPPPSSHQAKRIVIKVGTSSLVDKEMGIRVAQVALLLESVAKLRKSGYSVLLVTSGAVGTGAHVMKVKERPKSLATKQAFAAIGQVRLMRELNSLLSTLGVESAQVLLSYANLGELLQSINARNTIDELLRLGVVPVVNENDTVATEELRFGDNDRLSAMVANLIDADLLFLLTDVDGLYTANPNTDPNAKRIHLVSDLDHTRAQIKTELGPGSEFSTGGMDSKLQAAQIATRGGVRTIIMAARDVSKIPDFAKASLSSATGKPVLAEGFGTVFMEHPHPTRGRKRWILTLPPRGRILVDQGAANALMMKKSLFAAGVVAVEGKFNILEPVRVCDKNAPDVTIGVGLPNFSSADLVQIMGKRSDEIRSILGAAADQFEAVVVDRGNMAWTFDAA